MMGYLGVWRCRTVYTAQPLNYQGGFTGLVLVSWLGVELVINRLRVQLLTVHGRVSTWMGDYLCANKPFRFETDHL